MVTDLGVVTKNVEDALAYADAVVLESNHDTFMLDNGPYPRFLKQRIKGASGHLSNHDAARALVSIPRKETHARLPGPPESAKQPSGSGGKHR